MSKLIISFCLVVITLGYITEVRYVPCKYSTKIEWKLTRGECPLISGANKELISSFIREISE